MKVFLDRLGYWGGLASGVVGLIDFFCSDAPIWLKRLFFFFWTIALIFFLMKCYKYWKNTIDITGKAINDREKDIDHLSEISHEYLHDLRNICMDSINDNDQNKDKNYIAICNKIKQMFSVLLKNRKVCVCIKRLVEESANNSDVCNWKIKTLERSSNVGHERTTNDNEPVTIGLNSDFKVIITPNNRDVTFICRDLSDPRFKSTFYEKYGYDYNNSTEKYKATIVVPIRYQLSQSQDSAKYNILGFLCVDTDEPFSESDQKHLENSCRYLMAVADILYVYLHKTVKGVAL